MTCSWPVEYVVVLYRFLLSAGVVHPMIDNAALCNYLSVHSVIGVSYEGVWDAPST